MKKEFVHIFFSNNLTTALYIGNNRTEVLFSNIHISNLEKILTCLKAYQHLLIRLVFDNPNMSIKTFDLTGLSQWHRHELRRRLVRESSSYDWHCIWKENSNFILINGTFSDLETMFLNRLNTENFLIESAIPALWILNNVLLKNHLIKHNGVVQIQSNHYVQHTLYLNGLPVISRITKDPNIQDWQQFVDVKYKLKLDILDIDSLIKSIGKPEDSFASYILLQRLYVTPPTIVFSRTHNLLSYYQRFNLLRQFNYGIITATAISLMVIMFNLKTINDHQRILNKLSTHTELLIKKLPIDKHLEVSAQTHKIKHEVVERFTHFSFPVMSFLEKVSNIFPNYGQVIYARVTPKLPQFSANQQDEFSLHLRLVPCKNSKNLQLLTTELHKVFGSKIHVHIINSPITPKDSTAEESPLKHTVQINIIGLTHELQRLIP
jgi:hypothetical protein